jgi:putative addiction module component (TIGR02574 family)
MSSKEISAAAMKLPRKIRARLAEELRESLTPRNRRDVDAAWARVAEARIDEYNSGRAKLKPVAEIFKRLRKRNAN